MRARPGTRGARCARATFVSSPVSSSVRSPGASLARAGLGALAAIALLASAAAARPARAPARSSSVAACTSFAQSDKDETTVAIEIANRCTVPLACAVSWRVVCAPATKRRATHRGAARFTLATAANQITEATAAMCGEDAWQLDQVTWSCQPSPE